MPACAMCGRKCQQDWYGVSLFRGSLLDQHFLVCSPPCLVECAERLREDASRPPPKKAWERWD